MNVGRWVLAGALAGLAACGPDPGPGNQQPLSQESYYPLAVGNEWEYRVTDDTGAASQKVRRVTGTKALNGGTVWLLESVEGGQRLVAFNDYVAAIGVRRFRDESYDLVTGQLVESTEYDPYTLRMPRFAAGVQLDETYVQKRLDASGALVRQKEKTHRWSVLSVDRELTVPAGTFRTVHIRRLNGDGSRTREYWLAKGVGKVKETGDFTEELTRYDVKKDED